MPNLGSSAFAGRRPITTGLLSGPFGLLHRQDHRVTPVSVPFHRQLKFASGHIGGDDARHLIAVNAAAAILVSGRATSLDDALTAARESITNGGARERLAQFVAVTNELAPERQGE